LTDASPPPPVNVPLWTTFMVLCPPALLSVALIDIEPRSIAFVLLWLVIGLSNSALYAAIGAGISRMFRKSDWSPLHQRRFLAPTRATAV